MNTFRQQHPFGFALIAAVAAVLCFQIVPEAAAWLLIGNGVAPEVLYAFFQTLLAAIAMLLFYFASGGFRLGEQGRQAFQVRKALAVVALAALLLGVAKVLIQGSSLQAPALSAVVFAIMLLFTAVFEEVLFRGLLFEGFAASFSTMGTKNNALLAAAVASSALFGVLHITSDLGSLFRLTAYLEAAAKILEAGLFGIVMCALYATTRNIFLPIAVHFAFDLISELPIFLTTGVQTSSYITGSPADLALVAAVALMLVLPAKWAADSLRQR